jgi:aminopeptidase N
VQLIAPRFAQLGWDERAGESVEDRQLRGELAQALSRYGDADAIAEGRARFARYLAEPASLPASLVDSVLRIAGRHAEAATWEALKRLAEQAPTSEEKFRAYRALAEAQDAALAARTLALARDKAVPQIMRNELAYDVARGGHLEAAWSYARANAEALLADVPQYAGAWYIGGVVETSADPAHADQLEALAAARMPEGLTTARRFADAVRSRAKLKARLLPQLEKALADGPKALRPS